MGADAGARKMLRALDDARPARPHCRSRACDDALAHAGVRARGRTAHRRVCPLGRTSERARARRARVRVRRRERRLSGSTGLLGCVSRGPLPFWRLAARASKHARTAALALRASGLAGDGAQRRADRAAPSCAVASRGAWCAWRWRRRRLASVRSSRPRMHTARVWRAARIAARRGRELHRAVRALRARHVAAGRAGRSSSCARVVPAACTRRGLVLVLPAARVAVRLARRRER